MSHTITPDGNKITGIFCNFFGHHFVVSKKVTEHIKEYRCVHCNKQVTTDERGKLSPLTQKLKEINNTLEDMYQRRNRRRAAGRPERKRVA
jgi:transposase-like protein